MTVRLSAVRLRKLEQESRIQEHLREYGIRKISRRFGFSNIMEIPTITKVALNTGIGKLRQTKGAIKTISDCLQSITTQNPALTKSTRAIANFKVKKHEVVGLRLSLRGRRMLDFLDRTINLALPRSKTFSAVTSQSFDETGSLTVGIQDCSVFPEIWQIPISSDVGVGISIVVKPYDRAVAICLLRNLNFPIIKT